MQIAFQTDRGQKRKNNQDAVDVFENEKGLRLALVADGMGGHQAGDVASHLTVSDLGKKWVTTSLAELDEIEEWLLENIQEENKKLYAVGQDDASKAGMGTTLVAVVVVSKEALLSHVGDSRCYLIREENIEQLTEDHSLVNELVKSGEITPEMAIDHPRKNVLLRSIGVPNEIKVDTERLVIQPGDKLLLCSDGLTNMVSDANILSIITENSNLEKALERLVEAANEAGGTDNITAMLIENEEVASND